MGEYMKNIVIIGAGDLGKELVWLIEDINRAKPTYVIVGFLDDDSSKWGREYYGYSVLGGTQMLTELNEKLDLYAVIAMQEGINRRKIYEANPTYYKWESIVHPTAVIASSTSYGAGTVIFPNVTVSVDTKMGAFGLYYIQSIICNDCRIGDFVSVMSGALVSEHAEIGDECFLGAGACVYPHEAITAGTVLGVHETK